MKGTNGNTDKAKGTTNNRAIECSLYAPFSSLLFSFAIFPFHFLIFFPCFALLIFFISKEHTTINPKKIELNWIKMWSIENQDCAPKSISKLVGLETRFF
jgi:hypothetical protein